MHSSPIINDVSFCSNACDSIQWKDLTPSPAAPSIHEPGISGHSVKQVFDKTIPLYLTKDTTYQVILTPQHSLTEFSISHISPDIDDLFPELSQSTANQFSFNSDNKPINNGLISTNSTSLNHSKLSHNLLSAKPQIPHNQLTHIEASKNKISDMTIYEIWKTNNRKKLNRISAKRSRDNIENHIQEMESKLDLQKITSIKSICRKKINNINELDTIRGYLDRNQKNNKLIEKYGIDKLSNLITDAKRRNINSIDLDDLNSFKFLKKKARNLYSSTKSRFFKSEYIKKLESAIEANTNSSSEIQTPG
ncbi:bZIP transcription factor [Salinisphaera sp. G21_0]|uniref:bZIP transcription factor n=1 Tax=Salinisphaera sp. G21_0 TaxID=2821094 RepID=UPI001ADCF37C|nr:bZIP transcription factor [Salinisphaera sp. G21_0]MBO9482409.1 bZIP transcription factor [Salinisphaera sp. G21_0]